jgi:hypothetical protein
MVVQPIGTGCEPGASATGLSNRRHGGMMGAEKRAAMSAAADREDYLRSVQAAAQRLLLQAESIDEGLQAVFELAWDRLGWELAELWRVNRITDELHCQNIWHAPGRAAPRFEHLTRQITLPPHIGLPGRVWATNAPIWLTDAPQDSNFPRARIGRMEDLRAAFAVPVVSDREVLGVLAFYCREAREPDSALLDVMVAIAHQLGGLIKEPAGRDVSFDQYPVLPTPRTVGELATLVSRTAALVDQLALEGRRLGHTRPFSWGTPEDMVADLRAWAEELKAD